MGGVKNTLQVKTHRLDDVSKIKTIDLLKMDIQGAELSVLTNGREKLARAVAVQTEASFVPLYKGQPSFGEIDIELRKQGMLPHLVVALKKHLLGPMYDVNNDYAAINQVVEADIVYVRDFSRPELMDSEQLKHLALIAHHCYRSVDLTMNCIFHLVKRQIIPNDSINRYEAISKRSSSQAS
jgi:hypothetical protein